MNDIHGRLHCTAACANNILTSWINLVGNTVQTFCSEFTRIYDLEVDYDELTEKEYQYFVELCEMTGRFSDDEDELRIPNMYCSEKEILAKAEQIRLIFKEV